MQQVKFVKLHGLGNDFVFIDDFEETLELSPETVAHLCDRHFGIGADGVVLVRPSKRPECAGYMHYINSDGTLAEMCGNGVRCFSKFLVDNGYVDPQSGSYIADTLRGPLPISFKLAEDGTMAFATVDMDEPIFDPALVPVSAEANATAPNGEGYVRETPLESPWGTFAFTCVSMGNPHAICFLDNLDALEDGLFTSKDKRLETLDLNKIGAFFESHEAFPAKANIEFVCVEDNGLHMRVFERGCGETLACGTGSCATLVAAALTGRSARQNDVVLLGGTLHIEWAENNHVMMTGPAAQSFTGTVCIG